MVMLCALFGANSVAIKVSLAVMGLFTTAGLRFFVATLTLFFWAMLTKKKLAVERKQIGQLLIIGVIFFTQLSLFYFGQSKTTASHGTLIANVLPFFVMILAHFYLPGDSISLKKLFGLILGFCGVLILFFDTAALTREALQGDLTILMAVLVWSCNVIFTKKVILGFQPIQITFYPMLFSSVAFLICGFFFDGEMIRYIDSSIMIALFYQTFVTATFGMLAWNSMIRKYGATALHSFVFIMPISGVFLGVMVLDEPVTVNLVASIFFVVVGLMVVNKKEKSEAV